MADSGQLVVIEGIDGAGKTTVSKHLSSEHDFKYMCQPEDSWVGDVAREALERDVEPSCDLFLHLAAHANQQPRLKSALESSGVVLDRYYHSRVVYQSIQTGFSASEIEQMHMDWSILPSKVIILDISAREALERKEGAKDKFEKLEFLSEARSAYLNIFESQDNVTIVNGSQPKNHVLSNVESALWS